MKKMRKYILGVVLVFTSVVGLVGCSESREEVSYKTQKTEWVTDQTGYLTEETLENVAKLNEEVFVGYDLKPQYGVEVLLKLPEKNRDIDTYRNERFKELGIGDKEKDSGVLLVVDLDGRDVGIEVGYGLEDVIRDIEAGNIISGDMKEYLGDYMRTNDPDYLNKAVNQASEEISLLIEKADSGVLYEEREEEGKITFWDILFYTFLILLLILMLAVSDGSGGGYYGSSSYSGSSGGGFGGGRSGGGGASGGF